MNVERRTLLVATAAVLVLLVLAVLAWLLLAGSRAPAKLRAGRNAAVGTNLALDLRYKYSTRVFTPAPYDSRAEFPLRLDALGGGGRTPFSLYGKRISGMGRMLAKEPAPLLYDFVGQQSDSMFTESYKLEQLAQPVYEDAHIGGRLGLHQRLAYKPGSEAQEWPGYFPDTVKAGPQAFIEGWTFFTEDDLFFFYAISPAPLSDAQRSACLQVLNSLQFNAVAGPGGKAGAEQGTEQPESVGTAGDQGSASGEAEDSAGTAAGPDSAHDAADGP
jgi:hypothetical protein